MNKSRTLLALALVASIGFACKGSPTPPAAAPAPGPASVAQKVPPPLSVQPAQAPLPPAPPAFVYNPAGLRDPFEPFIKLEEKKAREPVAKVTTPQTPLQRYSTEELKLAGIIWGDEGKARALIEDPQGKGYAVGIGTLVGDRGGRVARILPDRIIIEERFRDILGEEKKAVANMTLHKSDSAVSK